MLVFKSLTQAYIKYHRRRVSQAWELNYGYCFRWCAIAHKLKKGKLISVTIICEDSLDEISNKYIQGSSHAFIKIKNKYYDSESINGVKDWHQLGFFIRQEKDPGYKFYYRYIEHPSLKSFRNYWKPTKAMTKSDGVFYRKLLKGQV